jgi:hypothetical protein
VYNVGLDDEQLIEFLSYEGVVTIIDAGDDSSLQNQESVDIGVFEDDTTTPTQSLQLETQNGQNVWVGPQEATPGVVNPGLIF